MSPLVKDERERSSAVRYRRYRIRAWQPVCPNREDENPVARFIGYHQCLALWVEPHLGKSPGNRPSRVSKSCQLTCVAEVESRDVGRGPCVKNIDKIVKDGQTHRKHPPRI